MLYISLGAITIILFILVAATCPDDPSRQTFPKRIDSVQKVKEIVK